MNKEQFSGQWNQIKGKIKEKWGKLTEDDLKQINGRREQLLGKLQSRYGFEKQKAEDELNRFEKTLHGHHEELESEDHHALSGARHSPSSMNAMGSSSGSTSRHDTPRGQSPSDEHMGYGKNPHKPNQPNSPHTKR